jgi:zinc protease
LDLAATLPLDPAVRIGKLDNGLSYYIRQNRKPEARADLWLVVDAGSVLEEEDQQGLAHFVEHMAFNGTESFAKHEIVNYLESIGMRFGPDVNASTNFDETDYTLRVPTDRPEILAKGLQILAEWSRAVAFEPDEIEKERGVVIEEWRLGRGAEARMRDKQLPVLFRGSRYAERLPIGRKEVLERAPRDAFLRFYRDWYRPDLMAVIAVGDFDPAAIESAIRERFAALPRPAEARSRPYFPVPDHAEPLFAVATDPEATDSSVAIYYKRPVRPQDTVGDYRRARIEGLYHDMLNARLLEAARMNNAPFLHAVSGSGRLVRSSEVIYQAAGIAEGGVLRGLEALLVEVERVRRHGFTATELERAKADVLRSYEQAFAERDKIDSANFAAEFERAFLEDEPVPGIAKELELVRALLPGITLAEVNRLASETLSESNRVVTVSAPEKPGAAPPREAELRAVFASAVARDLQPYQDRTIAGPLVPNPPAPGTLVTESRIPELGVTEWRLSNGARVILKPTDFQNDEVLLSGFKPGGTSLVSDADFLSAQLAPAIVREAGLGQFDRGALDKALAGKAAQAWTGIGELQESVGAGASPRDLETMFELAYLSITAPRRDDEAFRAFRERLRASLENRLADPETVFADKMRETISQGHPRRRPLTVERLAELDLDTAFRVYRERFADASGFTFILVGNFEPAAIQPLVLRWLGGLPAAGQVDTWRDIGVTYPEGQVRFEVARGLEPKSQVRLLLHGDAPWSREAEHDLAALAAALRIRLREVLREDLGGVYGVSVGGDLAPRPRQRYTFAVGFGCAPENTDTLLAAVFAEMAALEESGPAASVVERVRESERRELEVRRRENS